jgi:hypothetical protein
MSVTDKVLEVNMTSMRFFWVTNIENMINGSDENKQFQANHFLIVFISLNLENAFSKVCSNWLLLDEDIGQLEEKGL